MKKVLKWLGISVGALFVLAILGVVFGEPPQSGEVAPTAAGKPSTTAPAPIAKTGTGGVVEPAWLKSISKAGRDITNVSESVEGGAKSLVIDMKPSSGYDGASFFFMAAQEINKVVAVISKDFPDQLTADRIDFVLTAGLSDKYGNSNDRPVIRLSFDSGDVKKINYSGGNFTNWNLLNLALPVSFPHPAGKGIVKEYCVDKSNAMYAQGFCQPFR